MSIHEFKPKEKQETMTCICCPECYNPYLLITIDKLYLCEQCDVQVIHPNDCDHAVDFTPDE